MEKKVRYADFQEADRLAKEDIRGLSPQARLDLQARLIRDFYGDNPPRLERILTFTQREQR